MSTLRRPFSPHPWYLGGTASSNDELVLDGTSYDHDGVVEGTLHFGNELFRSTAHNDGTGLGFGAAGEYVVTITADLLLLEQGTFAQVLGLQVQDGRLNGTTDSLDDTLQIFVRHTTSTEDVTVGKVLRGQITDGQLGQNDIGTGGDNLLQLVVDDFPLSIDNVLVVLVC